MTSKRRPYTTYPREFKLEALRLMDESDRPTSEIAMQLGIRRNPFYKWKEQMTKKGDVPSAKRGRPKTDTGSGLALPHRRLNVLLQDLTPHPSNWDGIR